MVVSGFHCRWGPIFAADANEKNSAKINKRDIYVEIRTCNHLWWQWAFQLDWIIIIIYWTNFIFVVCCILQTATVCSLLTVQDVYIHKSWLALVLSDKPYSRVTPHLHIISIESYVQILCLDSQMAPYTARVRSSCTCEIIESSLETNMAHILDCRLLATGRHSIPSNGNHYFILRSPGSGHIIIYMQFVARCVRWMYTVYTLAVFTIHIILIEISFIELREHVRCIFKWIKPFDSTALCCAKIPSLPSRSSPVDRAYD